MTKILTPSGWKPLDEVYYAYGYLVLDKKGKPYVGKDGQQVFTQDKIAANKLAKEIGGTTKRFRY